MLYKALKLGEMLVQSGDLTEEQLQSALAKQKNTSKKLGEILVDEGFLPEKRLLNYLATQLGIPYVNLNTVEISNSLSGVIPESIARVNSIVPVSKNGSQLTIAMSDPLDYGTVRNIESFTKCQVSVVIAEKAKIKDKVRLLYSFQRVSEAAKELSESTAAQEENKAVEADASEPIVRFINNMFENAVLLKASDIHIEPMADKLRIRFRVDGHLRTYMETGTDIIPSVISRIKIIGNMNIAEKRVPQDGRISQVVSGQEIDLRISTLPSVFGEKAVIRITNALAFQMKKEALGFTEENTAKFDSLIHSPFGIVLVTGSTGSGKSTTLYTALREIVRDDTNIVTVENPVEMVIPGITQVEVNPRAGLTFSQALRAILRQDPDVLMIGEIRDEETAKIAASAAITGHLVFSTLHTFDAPSAIIRLIDMGIEPYMVASSLIGVISQRLLRKICPHCKKEYDAAPGELDVLQLPVGEKVKLYKGAGCASCSYTGYKGRTAVCEIMPITPGIKNAIHDVESIDGLRALALSEGMVSLAENAKAKVLSGEVTFEELLSVLAVKL